ncbi:HAD family hydrolase [Streptomyces koyangensis]
MTELFPSRDVRAVFLDVGGVLFIPDPEAVRAALAGAGLTCTDRDVDRAVYADGPADLGMGSEDSADTVDWHVRAFAARLARAMGTPPRALEPAMAGIRRALTRAEWAVREERATREGLRALAKAGVPVVVVTNAEGQAEGNLRRHRLCHVGPGPGLAVRAVVDSGAPGVGVSKPDPEIFRIALSHVGAAPAEVLHLGDSVRNDVACSAAVGITGVHFDPYAVCTDRSAHPHVTSLTQLAVQVGRRQRASLSPDAPGPARVAFQAAPMR